MDISNVGSVVAANSRVADKTNDGDKDDKGAKASNKAATQEVALRLAQNPGNTKPATPTAKSEKEDNAIQTKTPQSSKQGQVDVLA